MMENNQYHMKELDNKFKITVSNDSFDVQAPLQDGFGFTVGSEYSEPFDTGAMSETWQKVFAVGGISQKMGLRMKKMFTNPEPTEISFDMEFAAYYDAKQEVLIPIVKLMLMTLGTRLSLQDVEGKARELIEKISSGVESAANFAGLSENETDLAPSTPSGNITDNDQVNQVGSRLTELIKLVNAPKYVEIQWGNVAIWENCYITSVSPTFSNVLDADGIPMSGKVAVTVTPEMYPIADDIIEVFGLGEVKVE